MTPCRDPQGINDWLKQGAAERAEMEDLMRHVDSLRQLAHLLSWRSEASRNEPGSLDERSTGSPPGVTASNGQ